MDTNKRKKNATLRKKLLKFSGKKDCHPRKGYVNWWEQEGTSENKKASRRSAKLTIKWELTYGQPRSHS